MKKKKTPLFTLPFCGWHPWGLGAILTLTPSHTCSDQRAVRLGAGVDMAAEVEAP